MCENATYLNHKHNSETRHVSMPLCTISVNVTMKKITIVLISANQTGVDLPIAVVALYYVVYVFVLCCTFVVHLLYTLYTQFSCINMFS